MITWRDSRGTGVATILAVLFLYVPLAIVVLFSFHSTASVTFPFQGFSLRWYRYVLSSPDFQHAFVNSVMVGLVVAATTLVLGTAAAVGVSRSQSRLRNLIGFLFFLPITLPGLFLGVALLAFFSRLGQTLSLGTVALAHMVYVFPYFFLIARAALDRLDPALEEAAADLGATPAMVFRRVILPAVWPVLLAATALAFALSFDEFVITFFVIGPNSTLPLFIWSRLRQTVDPSIDAVSSMLLLTMFAVWLGAFLYAGRQIRRRGQAMDLTQTSEGMLT